MSALLNIDQYFLENIHVRTNPAYKESDQGLEAAIKASVEVRRRGPEPDFMISMSIEVNKEKKVFMTSPYYILIRIVGYFSFVENTDETMIKKMIGLNGPAVLYGVARGVVAQVTANCRFGKFILPTVNFVELTKRKTSVKRTGNKTKGKEES